MPHCKFIIELQAPVRQENIPKLYEKVWKLIARTGQVSLASKPYSQIIPGFDLSYNLAQYLLERQPQLNILFHVTCHDLNRVNLRARLTLLQQLGIKRLLVVSGDGYAPADEPRLHALQFHNSQDLVESIMRDFNWFESIAVAGYPGGNGRNTHNDEEECCRLQKVLSLGADQVYTQCVYDIESFVAFSRLLRTKFKKVCIIPSIALFQSRSELERIAKLTRVDGSKFYKLMHKLGQIGLTPGKDFSRDFILSLCNRLALESKSIDLCTFGQFDLASSLLDQLERTRNDLG